MSRDREGTPRGFVPYHLGRPAYTPRTPETLEHHDRLIEAATDGSLWELSVTTVPRPEEMAAFIETALLTMDHGLELPFVIVHQPSGRVVGVSRFLYIDPKHRKVEIGGTWL